MLARLDMLKLGDLFAPYSSIVAYYARMTQRPSFASANIRRAWVGSI
jgi:glutathione S-transferase